MSKYFIAEKLEEINEEYDFVSKSLGYAKENFNYYVRNGNGIVINEAITSLAIEKLKLEIKRDFLSNFLES